jgi:hypothetical protein
MFRMYWTPRRTLLKEAEKIRVYSRVSAGIPQALRNPAQRGRQSVVDFFSRFTRVLTTLPLPLQ